VTDASGGTVAYLAPEGFEDDLATELGDRLLARYGRLFLASADGPSAAWSANTWYDPVDIEIASIGDGVRKLKAIQRNWAVYSAEHHRRAALIQDQLPKVSAKPVVFGTEAPKAPLGSWTLVAPDRILAAARCSSPFPNGDVRFVEDREAPPSRAYLKLWEVFTLTGIRPAPGETCLDLGACPGGWTWVLATLGARVTSVDKAPLDPAVAAMPGVTWRRDSAFALDPRTADPVDWLFSDVICYPARLLGLVERWLDAGKARRFVWTLKFQGATDFATIARFRAIPGSRLLHLAANKHELTWLKL
jgi:23S rRNA (cytidine2498-2'-O)-methyltransferase